MKRNRICFLLGLLIFAVISVNGQILKDFDKYQYSFTQVDQMPQAAKEALMVSLNPIGAEKYINDITSVEVAVCIEEKDVKGFIKKAQKIIKKEKVSKLQSVNNEGLMVDFYAKEGEIIILSAFDNDFANITVFK